MQAHSPLDFDFFRGAYDMFEQMMQWMQSETGGTTHSEMELALRQRGFELMRGEQVKRQTFLWIANSTLQMNCIRSKCASELPSKRSAVIGMKG